MRRLLCALAATILAANSAFSAPISFNTALPVHERGLLFRTQGIWTRMHDDPSPAGREMDVIAVPNILVYGATSKLALMGVFPYLHKRLELRTSGAIREASGLGDIATLGRYEVFERSRRGFTARGAVFAGLEWPTGADEEADALGALPKPVQLGSGSFDPFLGTVWTAQWLNLQLDADLFYQRNLRANAFKFGDVWAQNTSLQYRLWPRALKGGVPSYLYGVLEANNVYQARNELAGVDDPDSGGYQLFLTPGVQWVAKRAVLELAAQLPVVQELHGAALKTDRRLIASVRLWY